MCGEISPYQLSQRVSECRRNSPERGTDQSVDAHRWKALQFAAGPAALL